MTAFTVYLNFADGSSPLDVEVCGATQVGTFLMGLSGGLGLPVEDVRLSTVGGLSLLDPSARLGRVAGEDVWLRVGIRGCGGKGGFGSQLRAQGGRMSSKKTKNFSSCRDLSGRRLKTTAAAKQLGAVKEYLKKQERERKERLKKKIEKAVKAADIASAQPKGALFSDTQYLQDGEDMVEEIQEVVRAKVLSSAKIGSAGMAQPSAKGKGKAKMGFGAMWGGDDEDMSGSESE